VHIVAVKLKDLLPSAAGFVWTAVMAFDVNQFYDGSTALEPVSKATQLPLDQVSGMALTASSLFVIDVFTGLMLSA